MVRATPEGDGPREFPQGARGMDIAPDGGLYVSSFIRVIEYDPEGIPIDSWRPETVSSGKVCNLGGAPVVPTVRGLVRRGPGGTNEGVGLTQAENLVNPVSHERLRRPGAQWTTSTRIVCSKDAAYVVMTYDEGPDSVFVHHRSGEVGRLPVPAEGDLGNFVLFGHDSRTNGAIIDPETGCHALVRVTGNRRFAPMLIHADSALVFRHAVTMITHQGRAVEAIQANSTNGVSLHPIRRVSGEPCPGMLPTVKGG